MLTLRFRRLATVGAALSVVGVGAVAVAAGACGGDDSASASPGDDGGSAGDATLDGFTGDDAASSDGGSGSDSAASDGSRSDGATVLDAGPFTVDTAFGGGGVLRINVATPGNAEAHAVARQADGKLVVAGFVRGPAQGPHVSAFVERLLPSGSLDATFGSGGIAYVTRGLASEGLGVFVQSTQKIVLVSAAIDLDATGETPLVTRFDASGALDTSFGNGGFVALGGFPWSGALQPDDSILVGVDSSAGIGVYRLQPNGAVDTSFGDGGVASIPTITGDDFAVLPQADGKILVGGVHGGSSMFLTRFTAAGAIDATFGNSGGTVTDNVTPAEIDSLAQSPDGTLVGSGRHGTPFGVGRYSLAGAPDSTFGTSGWTTLGTTASGQATAIAVQPDGKVVATGISIGTPASPLAARFVSDGGLDPTFGTNGIADLGLGGNAWVPGMALDPDAGAITIAGRTGGTPSQVGVARLAPSGAHDPAFAGGSAFTQSVSGSEDHAHAVALQPSDGKVLVAGGWANRTGAPSAALARVTTAGALDGTFANAGVANVSLLASSAGSVVVQSTGRVVVGAWSDDISGASFAAVAYGADGNVDSTFGAGGRASVVTVGGQLTNAKAMALGPADAIVLAGGNGTSPLSTAFVVAELAADGKPMTSGDAGALVTASTPASTFGATKAGATAAFVQPDGKIVAAGFAGATKLAIARYTTSGALDATFGTGGVTTTDLGSTAASVTPYAIVAQPDGALVVAARRVNADKSSDVVLVRYLAAGTLDASFGAAGLATYAMGHVYRGTLDLQPPLVGLARAGDGRFYVASTTSSDGLKENLLLLRFTAAGAVDAVSVVPLGAGNDEGAGVALDASGKLVVIGHTWTPAGGEDFFVARFAPPP